jgi:hypothetical protein
MHLADTLQAMIDDLRIALEVAEGCTNAACERAVRAGAEVSAW